MPAKPNRLIWAPAADQDLLGTGLAGNRTCWEQDLLGIWNDYVAQASAEIADKIVQEIVRAAHRVSGLPLSGRSRDDLKPGLRAVLSHPYVVFYRLKDSDVEVVRVLHERRNLPKALAKSD
jgi:toxin ParE1/3/4